MIGISVHCGIVVWTVHRLSHKRLLGTDILLNTSSRGSEDDIIKRILNVALTMSRDWNAKDDVPKMTSSRRRSEDMLSMQQQL